MRPLALPLSPTRLETVLLIANLSGSGRSEMVSLAIPMRVNAGDSIPISHKERKAPKDCGCKRERGKGGKVLGQKSFCKNFGNGGVGPPIFWCFPALPPSRYPPGGFTWNVLGMGLA